MAAARRSAALVALVTAFVLLLTSSPASAAESEQRTGERFYLSLGDSLAFGFQRFKVGLPAEAFDTGYADLLAAGLQHGQRRPTLVNYGCPGESTTTFATGQCPWAGAGLPLHDAFTGPQQAAAVRFLRDHRGKVDLVTLSLWGNDANEFIASCNGSVQCILDGAPAAIARIAANLSGILQRLHQAAPDARIVVLGAFDGNVGAFPLTHPIIRQLNLAMAAAAAGHRARFADPMPIFNPEGDTGAVLCTLTLLCRDGDLHPSDAGYRALADLLGS
jgi:lysophospholipase L1-like esterase